MSSYDDPGSQAPAGSGAAPGGAGYEQLEDRLAALSQEVSNWRGELDEAASRSSRLEGLLTGLPSLLESWKSDLRESGARSEARVLRGLDQLDSRVSQMQMSQSAQDDTALTRDPEQWLRLIRGLDFLDERLQRIEQAASSSAAQLPGRLNASLAGLEHRLDAIEARVGSIGESELPRLLARIEGFLTEIGTNLQSREPAAHEATTKIVERLKWALGALDESLRSIFATIEQSGDQLETAVAGAAGGIEILREEVAARAGQASKLLKEGMEGLDNRMVHTLRSVAEDLGSAVYALNRTVSDWQAATTRSQDEMRQELLSSLEQVRSELAGQVKEGLEVLGRREERMLALILGGGPAASGAAPEAGPRKRPPS